MNYLKRNIKERRQFDNKKPEGLESEFDNFDVDNSYPNLPFKGRNIVDLDFVYKQLLDRCKAYRATLFLTQCQRERLIGLASISYLSCQNCEIFVTMCSRYAFTRRTQQSQGRNWIQLPYIFSEIIAVRLHFQSFQLLMSKSCTMNSETTRTLIESEEPTQNSLQ